MTKLLLALAMAFAFWFFGFWLTFLSILAMGILWLWFAMSEVGAISAREDVECEQNQN